MEGIKMKTISEIVTKYREKSIAELKYILQDCRLSMQAFPDNCEKYKIESSACEYLLTHTNKGVKK